jgi:hypothetical protein
MITGVRTSRDKLPAGFSAYNSTASLPSTVKAENTTIPMPFHDCHAEKVCPEPQSRGAGGRQAGTSYCCCRRSRLMTSHSENRPTERPEHEAHSVGNRDQTAPRMERHRRPQLHARKLLDIMEIPRCEERTLERHWGSADGRSKIAQIVLRRSRVNDMLTELHGGPAGGHLGVNKTLDNVRQRYC